MEKTDFINSQSLVDLQRCVKNGDDFLITSHINIDGDSITSCLAFASLCTHLGKKFSILIDDEIPHKFDFLSGISQIQQCSISFDVFNPHVVVVLDSSNRERIGKVSDMIPPGIDIINIDHHPSNIHFGTINLINPDESSTVEIIYSLLDLWNVPISPEIATYIYTGIMCDTGRFIFSNTTHRSLAICSEMINKGASPEFIAKNLYYRTSQETIRALAAALSTIEFHFNGRVACIYLSNGILSNKEKLDTEGFVDYLMAIEGTEVEFFMMEKLPNVFKVSFRSKLDVDVNAVAHKFGGGGHTSASGCTIEGDVEEIKKKILDELRNYM